MVNDYEGATAAGLDAMLYDPRGIHRVVQFSASVR